MLLYLSHTGCVVLKSIENLSNLSPEVDYQALMAHMRQHSHPRRKIQDLQKKGQLIRLKKGFYVLSKEMIGRQYSPQIVANLLYGPSYLSLEFALSAYGLIPERVELITSVSTQKNKFFKTPIGNFSYQHLATSVYPLGITLKKTLDDRSYLIASPEKALMDLFSLRFSNSTAPTKTDLEQALVEDLRINLSEVKQIFRRQILQDMQPHYKRRLWNKLLINFLLELL